MDFLNTYMLIKSKFVISSVLLIALLSLQHSSEELVPQYAIESQPQSSEALETMVEVIDGDTIRIKAEWNPYPKLKWYVRIRGIDTPEKNHLAKCPKEKALALQATNTLKSIFSNSSSKILLKNIKHDRSGGRFDADVFLVDGTDVGKKMIDLGIAKPYFGRGAKPNWCI